jgi:hypothetical protein
LLYVPQKLARNNARTVAEAARLVMELAEPMRFFQASDYRPRFKENAQPDKHAPFWISNNQVDRNKRRIANDLSKFIPTD